jgi:hypothetical protein
MAFFTLLHPSDGLSLQELIIARNTTEAAETAALPATVGQGRLIVNSQGVNMNGTREKSGLDKMGP